MTQLSILSGSYADETADWRVSMPINKEPIIGSNGIAQGNLGQVIGVTAWQTGYGPCRGAINWNGADYRVMGDQLLRIADGGAVTVLGTLALDANPCSLDYSFDRLCVTSAGNAYYWDGTTLTQITDPDLGIVFDVMYIDGVFMFTDGTSIVITDVNNPLSINPLRYGSAESDPDPIQAVCKIRGEAYALGQYTTQNFQDAGGSGFPYQNNLSGFIPRGICGRKTWSYFLETFAFLGCARREAPSVYLAGAGFSRSISTQEIDKLLSALTPTQLAAVVMEARNEQNEQRLFMHLPDRTLVYMNQASVASSQPIWITLNEGPLLDQPYTARYQVPVYGKWVVGSTTGNIGFLDDTAPGFWGAQSSYEFQTNFVYNASMGGIVHRLELVALPGRAMVGSQPFLYMSTSIDGETWGQERRISAGKSGERSKRLVWWPNRRFANYIAIRFRGEGNSFISFTRLEAEIEPLSA